MQVDQKPSPWPCVVMLGSLFLLCIAMPRLWTSSGREQVQATQAAAPSRVPSNELDRLTALNRLAAQVLGTIANDSTQIGVDYRSVSLRSAADSPYLTALTTIPQPDFPSGDFDPLAALNPSIGGNFVGHGHPYGVPSTSGSESIEIATTGPHWPMAGSHVSIVSDVPHPYVLMALEGFGQAMSEYSSSDIVSWLAFQVAAMTPVPKFDDQLDDEVTAPAVADDEHTAPQVTVEAPATQPIEYDLPAEMTSTLAGDEPASTDQSAIAPHPVEPIARPADPPSRAADAPAVVEPAMPLQTPTTSEPSIAPQADAGPWSVPRTLIEQLDRVARHPFATSWALTTIDQLQTLAASGSAGSSEVGPMLDDLTQSSHRASELAQQTSDDRLRVELLRLHWALKRRLDCWKVISEIHTFAQSSPRIVSRGSLHALFAGVAQSPSERSDLPVLSEDLESYESSRDPQLARQVAQQRQALGVSPDELDQSLADAVEQNYRNANVRVALTAEFINRLIAERREEDRQVRDRIAGTPVRGHSRTSSRSRVSLQPATGYWHLNVETNGVVESDTLANGGQARLRTFGATDFAAQKSVIFDVNGVRLSSASVAATNYSHLANVRTEYDGVPLLGSYARDRAVREYRAKRPRAKFDVEAKVAAQTADQVDREIADAVDRAVRTVRERLTDPITRSGIEITPIELTTTPERLVARLRVAGEHQLGSHTPRPRALSDSLASLQLHETALTNAATSLAIDGQRLTASELRDRLRSRFSRKEPQPQAETHPDTVFEFAEREAIKVLIDDGKVELVVSLARFEHQGRASRNVIVHAHYVPVVDGLSAELVRDGPLGIEGRLGSGERARLHNAFNEVLSTDRRLPLLPIGADREQQLAGITVTQLVLEDGWLGMAIGPNDGHRVTERSRSLH